MSESEPVLVYIILGATGSARRAVIADLIDGGLAEDERAVVFRTEADADAEAEKALPRVATWSMGEGTISVSREAVGDATHVFLLTDGRSNPVDQMEAIKPWLDQSGYELGRVITVVNCRLAEQNPELIVWYEACIHFSDVALLAFREGVANKWMSDFQSRFKDQAYPCLFEFVKGGRVKNPPLILEPQARRMSHLFDEPDWVVVGDEEIEEGSEIEGEETTEEVEVKEEVDPYLERRIGGRRVKEIPDIGRVLAKQESGSEKGNH
jgi:hypothetical protein